jgi:hypothetical protein
VKNTISESLGIFKRRDGSAAANGEGELCDADVSEKCKAMSEKTDGVLRK